MVRKFIELENKNISLFQNLVYTKSKSIDNSLSVTPDMNDELLQLNTNTDEGDCNRYCTSMSYSHPYLSLFYIIYIHLSELLFLFFSF